MPWFEYEGLTPSGQTRRGTIEAENLKAAKQKLKAEGIFATHIVDKTRQTAAAKKLQNPVSSWPWQKKSA